MPDHLTPEERSAHMRKITKRNTSPEMVVRRAAHALGLRFRLHRKDLPGTPDLTFPKHRKVILVHGCFWHQHPGCVLARQPKTRPEYWLPKLARNTARDAEVQDKLLAKGWRPLVIWECETKRPEHLRKRVREFLCQQTKTV